MSQQDNKYMLYFHLKILNISKKNINENVILFDL